MSFNGKLFELCKAVGFIPLGVDIETSTNDEDGVILSVGIYDPDRNEHYYREIRHKKLYIMPESSRIHQLDLTKCDDHALLTLHNCDIELRQWIGDRRVIPTGWNVGAYDIKTFIEKQLPKTANQLGRRSIDLNSLCFALALRDNMGFRVIKRELKIKARQILEVHYGNEKWCKQHNALYDAYEAIVVLWLVMKTI